MKLDLSRFNQKVADWQHDTVSAARASAGAMQVEHRTGSPSKRASLSRVRGRVQLRDGAAQKVSITFPRSLVYTMKGAGKGRGGVKGSRWTDKYGKSKQTNAGSLGKMGTGGRTAKPFLEKTLDGPDGVEKLATICAEELGTVITSKIFQ